MSPKVANEPSLRRAARDLYRKRSTVSTRPTAKGKVLINPFHPLFGIHWLENKPLEVCMYVCIVSCIYGSYTRVLFVYYYQ
jgi:hypothetical protein